MRTALYEKHQALGAKFVDFGGWEMPLQYTNLVQEHHAVRTQVGIFDVSHMGCISISGENAENFLDYLSTNRIAGRPPFSATYTVLCLPSGGCTDDVIIYKESEEQFFVVVNAGNRQKDYQHFVNQAVHFQVEVKDLFQNGIIAIQGPKSEFVLSRIFSQAHQLKPMHFCWVEYQGHKIMLASTGYTGEKGFEVYIPHPVVGGFWDRLLEEGKAENILPIGLGARDTLRLEKGYALYGHEISESIAPNESVSKWTIKWDKKDFLGKSALELLEKSGEKRSEYGIVVLGNGVAREGYEVFYQNKQIGGVTSGTFSPTLGKAIAIIIVQGHLNVGDIVEVQIRQNRVSAEVVNLPFLQ